MKIKKAIIPAAGMGTRFLPATKAQPKEMLPIVDKPTIQYIVEEAVASGIESIMIITGRSKRSIEDHFDKSYELEAELKKNGKTDILDMVESISNMVEVNYVRQKEARGLGHAILCAHSFVGNEPFAVLLGDDVVYNPQKPCLRQLMDVFEEKQASVLGVQPVELKLTSQYGIVKGSPVAEGLHLVEDLVEKPKTNPPSNIAILGRYIIMPRIFEILKDTQPGAGGEIQLTDALRVLAKEEQMYACEFSGRRYDVGSKEGFLEATVEYALRRDDLRDEFSAFLKTLKL